MAKEETKKPKKGVVLKCDNCGSSDVEIVSDKYAKCKQCKTKILIPQPEVKKVIKKETHIHLNRSNNESYFTFEAKNELTEDEFLRGSLIELANDSYTPRDIFEKMEIGEIETLNSKYFILKDVEFNMTYSASIGYHRKEQYEDYENQYDPDLKRNVKVRVIKERTVTDWKPFSSTENLNTNVYGISSETKKMIEEDVSYKDRFHYIYGEKERFRQHLRESINSDEIECVELEEEEMPDDIDFTIHQAEYDDAISDEKSSIAYQYEHYSLPGDEKKGFSYQGSARVNGEKMSFWIPEYKLNYKYDGQEYNLKRYKTSKRYTSSKNVASEKYIENEVARKTRLLGIASTCLFSAYILYALIYSFAFAVENFVLTFFLFLIPVGFFIIYKSISKIVSIKVKQEFLQHKKSKLNEILKKHNLEPLSAEEKSMLGMSEKSEQNEKNEDLEKEENSEKIDKSNTSQNSTEKELGVSLKLLMEDDADEESK